MKRKISFMVVLILSILSMSNAPQVVGHTEIVAGSVLLWQLEAVPTEAFNMYYTGGGDWLAENGSVFSFHINSFVNDYLGYLYLGNVSVLANDTDIAKDLTLGVWGTYTEWWPGLIIDTGQSNIDVLNASAYASAERLEGNYLNGTMISKYEQINASGVQYQCIVFDFEQDAPGNQITHLAYSLETGVLIEANTSYSFGISYELAFTFQGFEEATIVDFSVNYPGIIIFTGAVGGVLLAMVILVYIEVSKRKRLSGE
jgi:hypothetical protein